MATVVLFNKPFNVLSQFSDQQSRATLADYIDIKGVYPAGRLDYDSEGLLVLTDDGELQHQISHPDAKLPKTYWVQVEGSPRDDDLQPLREGVALNDGRCKPAQVRLIEEPKLWVRNPPIRERNSVPTRWLAITLSEGRNRQVRRMTAAVGHPTLRLVRIAIGNWRLNNLQPGEYSVETVHRRATPTRRRTKPRKATTNNRRRGSSSSSRTNH